jgi:hypothetical protein
MPEQQQRNLGFCSGLVFGIETVVMKVGQIKLYCVNETIFTQYRGGESREGMYRICHWLTIVMTKGMTKGESWLNKLKVLAVVGKVEYIS